ncbi:Ctr copper transporter family-domain-containing protein [Rhizoctonia solani]|nr:Ctr copper transporter family-domain-containing protein [Rhizoctonia solani]
MDMDHMHGGDSSSSSNLTDSRFTHMCSVSILWNWEVVDSCFISDQWHVTNEVGFAFSIIGIFLITFLIEGLRRAARNYDRMLAAKHSGKLSKNGVPLRPTMSEQLVRGGFYGVQFSAAYVLMLIAMSFNGFALFAIFLGGTAGYIMFSTDTLKIAAVEEIQEIVNSGTCCD